MAPAAPPKKAISTSQMVGAVRASNSACASLSGEMASVAICLIGLGLGAEIDIAAFVVARYFGVRNFSSVYGMVAFSLSVSGAIGSALIGASYDNYGSYDAALIIIAVAVVLAGFVYLLLGRYPKPELSELKH